MKTLRFSLFCAVLSFLSISVPAQATCYTQPTNSGPNFTYGYGFWPGWENNGDKDLFDYALILEDAKKRDCSLYAKEALKTKIQQTNLYAIGRTHTHVGTYTGLGPYQDWLEGAQVAFASAAALAIGGNGDMTSELDAAVQEMITNFNTRPASTPTYYRYGLNTNCGVGAKWKGNLGDSDTCMDDHVIGALGHAWAAAYQNKRGNTASRDANITKAQNAINDALSLTEAHNNDSICLHDPQGTMSATGRGPCNVTNPNDISTVLTRATNPGYVFALNRGENQVYGFGLIASLSGAAIGLEEAGSPLSLTSNQKLIIQALLDEAQRKSQPTYGDYFNGELGGTGNCALWDVDGSGNVVNPNNGKCADTWHRPRMYSLVGPANSSIAPNTFFSIYLPGVSAKTNIYDPTTGQTVYNAFQFNRFDFNDFKIDYNDTTVRPHWARAIGYGNFGYYWLNKVYDPNPEYYPPTAGELRPRLSATYDDHDPIGYIDSIDTNGVALGWTCDQDVPTKQTWVDFYRDNVPGVGTYLGQARANLSSESAINNWCGGGTAHRFSMQLPSSAKGHYIYPYGLDGTWRGYLLLPPSGSCPGGVCIYP